MKKELNFLSFGSGSSGNCYYFYTAQGGLLIDAGLGVRMLKKYFNQYGVSLSKISAILVTHDHVDHARQVGALSKDAFLPVYATAAVNRGIMANHCLRKKIPAANWREITVGEGFDVGDMHITPFAVPHDSYDCVGFRIACGSRVLVLATDVGHITPQIAQQIADADYLVLESNYDKEMLLNGRYPAHLKTRIMSPVGHLSNDECGQIIAQVASEKLQQVWLCHLSEENNTPYMAIETVQNHIKGAGRFQEGKPEVQALNRRLPTGAFCLDMGEEE